MGMEPRLEKRYQAMVKSELKYDTSLSAGVKQELSKSEAFNQTQAAWRFLNNERCTLSHLMEPIFQSALEQSKDLKDYCLVAHDWSGLNYKTHHDKKDRKALHNSQELGYELQASILLNDSTGAPVAPIALNVETNTTLLSTYRADDGHGETHLIELTKRIHYLEDSGFDKPLVHIVDREADSAYLMRNISASHFLFRARSNSIVEYQNTTIRLDKLAKQLDYTQAREIRYRGQQATQYIGQTQVTVTRAAQVKKRHQGKKQRIAGESVLVQLVVSQVKSEDGRVLAVWYLVSNMMDIAPAQLALWYYWRWSIETFFKLLKSAGMQLESWQQKTGEAIARRLLVACMACVYVWELAECKGPAASELRKVLIRLSGRQMKYGVEFTKPALFAGLSSLLSTLNLLENYDIHKLKQLLRDTIGNALV